MTKVQVYSGAFQMKNDNNFSEVVRTTFAEAKDHLTESQFTSFLFDNSALDEKSLDFIRNHISTCTRCKEQIEEVERNKEFYLNSSKIAI